VKNVLTEIAWAATRTKNTFYHARYQKLAARRGKKRALIAVGHSILKSVYHILKDNCEYKELGAEYLINRTEAKRKAYLKSELGKLGYLVELKELPPVEKAG
jgi:transposase